MLLRKKMRPPLLLFVLLAAACGGGGPSVAVSSPSAVGPSPTATLVPSVASSANPLAVGQRKARGSGVPNRSGHRGGAASPAPPNGPGAGSPAAGMPAPEVWQYVGTAVDQRAAGGGMIMSEAVRLDDGRYRMYYAVSRIAGGKDIGYAESADATTWSVRGLALAGSSDPSDREYEINGPSLVRLPDGRWRMYYDATSAFTGGPSSPPFFTLRSAVSPDGVHFTREGIRIGITPLGDPGASLDIAAHGRVIVESGTYIAIFSGSTNIKQLNSSGLFLTTSSDGLTFSTPRRIFSLFHDPLPIRVGDLIRMYADDSIGATPKDSAGVTYSRDGVTWPCEMGSLSFQDRAGGVMRFGGQSSLLGDIGGIVLPNGELRLFTNYNGDIAYFSKLPPSGPNATETCHP